MYASFFGMKETPFGITPDPKFVFWSRGHQEALAHLLYGVKERKGFILLTGEVGVGKTLLCRCLLDALGDDVHTALILNPVLTADDFLRRINQDFGNRKNPRKKPLGRLNAFLLDEYANGRNCLLIIDETQTLPLDVLEQLRLISNLETESSKLIQILLVGQEELNDILDLHAMRQLKQRIAVSYHMRGLDEAETEAYILHRLKLASGGVPVRFTPGAVRAAYRATEGNPRLINIVCDRALLEVYSAGGRVVDRKAVRAAWRETHIGRSQLGKRGAPGPAWWGRRLGWAVAVCTVLAFGFFAGRMLGWP